MQPKKLAGRPKKVSLASIASGVPAVKAKKSPDENDDKELEDLSNRKTLAEIGSIEQANRDKLANRALESLSNPTNVLPEADRRYYFGKAQLLLGEADDAIQEYRHALELSPYQIEWRIELTYILLKHKSIMWALREAETCVAIAPEQKRLQEMVRDLQGRLAAERAKPITNRKIQVK